MQERISTNRHAGQLSLGSERSGEGVKRGVDFKFAAPRRRFRCVRDSALR
jgi:hypothetical protein